MVKLHLMHSPHNIDEGCCYRCLYVSWSVCYDRETCRYGQTAQYRMLVGRQTCVVDPKTMYYIRIGHWYRCNLANTVERSILSGSVTFLITESFLQQPWPLGFESTQVVPCIFWQVLCGIVQTMSHIVG